MKNARPKISFLTILFIIAVLLSGIYFARRSGTSPNSYSNDFNVYFFAAREIIEGRTPYENSLSAWTPYLYLPLLAELLVPLALLPLSLAAYLWFLISAVAVFVAMRMSASLVEKAFGVPPSGGILQTQKFSLKAGLQTLTAVILLRFILDNFDYGQVNMLVAALAIAHFYFYEKNKKLASIVAFILATSIKLTPLVFIVYHLAKRRVKFAAACAVLFVFVTALSFAPFGSNADEAFTNFWERTIKNRQGFNLAYPGNQSLRAAIERIRGNDEVTNPSNVTTTAIGIILLGIAFFVANRKHNDIAAIASFFCLTVLLSPLSWKQHFVMLILPIAFITGEALNEKEKTKKYLLISLLVVVFTLFNLTSPKLIGVAAAQWGEAHSLVFAGALITYVACVSLTLRHHSSPLVEQKITQVDT